jgi:hypothetical protein
MTIGRIIAAVAGGVLLASMPFLHFGHLGGGHNEAHADHEARHGGQLGMVGDYHIELVRQRGEVQVFVSDAWRRPIEPVGGWVTFDDDALQPLTWTNHRLVGVDRTAARTIAVAIAVADGTNLTTSFVF